MSSTVLASCAIALETEAKYCMIACNGKSHAGRRGTLIAEWLDVGTVGEVLGRCCSSRVFVVVSAAVVSVWSCLSLGGEVPLEMAVSHHLATSHPSRISFPSWRCAGSSKRQYSHGDWGNRDLGKAVSHCLATSLSTMSRVWWVSKKNSGVSVVLVLYVCVPNWITEAIR